jgi:hypothetical protein
MRACVFFLGLVALFAGPAAAQRPAPQRLAPPPAPLQATPAPMPSTVPTRLTAKGLGLICNQNEGACLTYVLGAIDAFVATSIVNYGRTDLCFPAQVTNMQIAGVAIAYVRAHPEAQDRNAAIVVLSGVRASFPCH